MNGRTARFFVDLAGENPHPAIGDSISISGPELHHLKNVLRLSVGAEIEAIDRGSNTAFRCELTAITDDDAEARILEAIEGAPSPQLTLIAGITKPKVSDFIAEKAVELGISRLHFFSAERSQGRLSEESSRKTRLERLERIATSAMKQSGAHELQGIAIHDSLEGVLMALPKPAPEPAWRLLFVTPNNEAKTPNILESLAGEVPGNTGVFDDPREPANPLENLVQPAETYIIIGPEGGLTEAEEQLAISAGFSATTLGPKTLRSETAVIAACAQVLLVLSGATR